MITGGQLKAWRLGKNFTIEQLAYMFDVSSRTIRNYEKSANVPLLVYIALEWYDGRVYGG